MPELASRNVWRYLYYIWPPPSPQLAIVTSLWDRRNLYFQNVFTLVDYYLETTCRNLASYLTELDTLVDANVMRRFVSCLERLAILFVDDEFFVPDYDMFNILEIIYAFDNI